MSWEKSVIASGLADPAAMGEAEGLMPSDFTLHAHSLIWGEMLALHSRGSLDGRALIEALRTSKAWNELGEHPEDFIAEILTYRGTNLREYADQVVSASIRRALRRNIAMISGMADQDTISTQELLDDAEKRILSLRRSRADEGVTIGDLIGLYLPRFEAQRSGTFTPAWTPHIQANKDVMLFAEDTDLIVVAGRPGDGKSSVMRYEMYMDAARGTPVAVFNLDNDPMDYVRAFICLHINETKGVRLENTDLRSPRSLTPELADLIRTSAQEITRMPLYVIHAAGWNADRIARAIRRYRSEKDIRLVGIDYIQQIFSGIDNRVQDLSYTSSVIRNTGLQLGVPIMVASQLSRDIERRGAGSEPQLADLRDSGSIEQDATIVAFPRNTWTNPTAEQIRQFPENVDRNGRPLANIKAVPVRFWFQKNRNGPTRPSDLVKWDRSTGVYHTLARE